MSNKIMIDKEIVKNIIKEAYSLINKKEITGQSKTDVVEKIVDFMKKEVSEDAD